MDTQKNTKEELIYERFNSLPEIIRLAITESGWENKIRLIVRKYGLRIDQGGTLETKTLLFMLALIDVNEFEDSIKNEIGLDAENATKIITEIDTEVLAPIKEHIISFTEEEDIASEEELEEQKEVEPTRDDLLKEIEDQEEGAVVVPNNTNQNLPAEPAHLELTSANSTVPTAIKSTPQNQTPSPVAGPNPVSANPTNPVVNNLSVPKSESPQTVKFDPYRELPE